jgi:hypothetical protein
MSRSLLGGVLVLIAAMLFVAYSALFTVHQTQQALVLRFGEVRTVVTEPGLHWKVPVADNVVMIDKRILDLDSPVQELIAADQRRLVVDAFARYRIVDPLRFYQSVGSVAVADSRLADGAELVAAPCARRAELLRRGARPPCRADGGDHPPGEPRGGKLRHRCGRRADPPGRSAAGQRRGDLRPHADRASAGSGPDPRRRRGGRPAHPLARRSRCDGHRRRGQPGRRAASR